MISESEVIQLLRAVGAVITDSHIVYTHGGHGSGYVNKDGVYPYTRLISQLCREIAGGATALGQDIETVIAPAVGGVILTQWVADHLTELTGRDRDVMAVYAEKEVVAIPDPENLGRKCYAETGRFVIQRGYDKFVRGKKVLVLDDILNTGGSARHVVDAARRAGGKVVAAAALWNRGNVTKESLDVPYLFALANMQLDIWSEADCPLCAQQVPINTEVGKGRDFLARRQQSAH